MEKPSHVVRESHTPKSMPTMPTSPAVTCGRQNHAPRLEGILMRWKQSDACANPSAIRSWERPGGVGRSSKGQKSSRSISILGNVAEEHKATDGGVLKNMFSGPASIILCNFVFEDIHTKNTQARDFARSTAYNMPREPSCLKKVRYRLLLCLRALSM